MTETEARRLLELGREAVLTGPEATEWLERLRPERENLRGAIEWLAANGELDAATDLAVSVWRLWLLEGQIPDGRQVLARVLDGTGDAPPSSGRAQALYADGLLAFREGDQAH
jgi:predicted ATPase